jgi:hypothetical protein
MTKSTISKTSIASTVDSSTGTISSGTGLLTGTTLVGNTTNIPSNWYSSNNSISSNMSDLTIEGRITHDLGNDGITYQHEVAVLSVTRNDTGQIIRSKVIKTMWVETLNQGSIDYAASKDPEVSKLKSNEIIIKTLRTIKL